MELNRKVAGPSERTVSVGTHEVRYLEGGQGEVVVLLHGIFGEKDHWVDYDRQLTHRYRVIVPDLPGFGGNSRLAGESYGYAAQMQRLVMLLERLGLKRVHIAGSSMGGPWPRCSRCANRDVWPALHSSTRRMASARPGAARWARRSKPVRALPTGGKAGRFDAASAVD
ncbi:alpha/beta fold hydrolase [Pseudomonas boanensis]|uniref:alpha/beta fold hydrolase n=1 Tax=Metapseudomonas boanensis TaxID=2822138 RepID=UPI0035D4DEAC